MKNKLVKLLAFVLAGVLLCSCFTGCGAKSDSDKKEQNKVSAEKKDKDSKKEPSVDEESKDSQETAGANTEEPKKEEEEKKQDTQTSNSDSKKPSSNKNNGTTTSATVSSTKKVSFNKDKLYNMMAATYKVPDYVKEPTRSEFAHEVNGQIPAKAQRVFNWLFDVVDTGKATALPVSDEEIQSFEETINNRVLNYTVQYRVIQEGGNKKIDVDGTQTKKFCDDAYNSYCNQVKAANEPAKKQYESYLAEVKKDCDLIENAMNGMNVKGKDEVTAINAIINYICKNCTYGQGKAEGSHSLHTGHTGEWITDCLEGHKAVCNGYAKTFYAMCYYAGIDVTYYWGHTDTGEVHAWDSVKIGGKDYYFDVTWQDALMESGSSKQTYIWADKTTFGKEHIKDGTDVKFW